MDANRFDALRLGAALAVVIAHGDYLYRLHVPVAFPGHSLGSLAVYVFFFISGYLIAQSWERRPLWGVFWIRRVMRIYPGLVVAVVFSVAVVGWLCTTLPATAYWSAALTWIHLMNNMTALATVHALPGVFESNPLPYTVNGSLWTIRYELAMYLLLALLGWGGRGRRWLYPAAAAGMVALWMAARYMHWDDALRRTDSWAVALFRWEDFCAFGVPFFLGSSFAVYQLRARSWMVGVAALAALVALLAASAEIRQMAVWLLIAFGVFSAAFVGVKGGIDRGRMDLSYGVYIYAFPVQQALAQFGLRYGWAWNFYMAATLVLVLVLAWLSWHCVERHGIQVAQRMSMHARAAMPLPT